MLPKDEPFRTAIDPDPPQAAAAAGLRYVSDDHPGITRRRAGKGFSYRDPSGRRITDRAILTRVKALAVPPAWRDVWICPYPDGHLQATGRDARGRKQHRYHERWREIRSAHKFHRMLAFGRALPRIRQRVQQDLGGRPRARSTVLAAVVRLLETTLIRVGNEEYVRQNRSYGLTTLRERHVEVQGQALTFEFKGKSGKVHHVEVHDRRVARIVRRLEELPGQELFQYLDDEGVRRTLASDDVNVYLREIAGDAFTAKDFRTWSATVLAAWALAALEPVEGKAARRKAVMHAIEGVAQRLGNTVAMCRKCYVHPEIVAGYLDGTLLQRLKVEVEETLRGEPAGLRPEEVAVYVFLHRRLETEETETRRRP